MVQKVDEIRLKLELYALGDRKHFTGGYVMASSQAKGRSFVFDQHLDDCGDATLSREGVISL
jgi:hypothetical protein